MNLQNMDFVRRSHLSDIQNSKYKNIGQDFGQFKGDNPTIDVLLDAYYSHPKYSQEAQAQKNARLETPNNIDNNDSRQSYNQPQSENDMNPNQDNIPPENQDSNPEDMNTPSMVKMMKEDSSKIQEEHIVDD